MKKSTTGPLKATAAMAMLMSSVAFANIALAEQSKLEAVNVTLLTAPVFVD